MRAPPAKPTAQIVIGKRRERSKVNGGDGDGGFDGAVSRPALFAASCAPSKSMIS